MFTGITQPTHLLFILLIILLLFGAKRLPELGRSMGRSVKELRAGMNATDEPEEEEKRSETVEEGRHSARAEESGAQQRGREATAYSRRDPASSDRDLR